MRGKRFSQVTLVLLSLLALTLFLPTPQQITGSAVYNSQDAQDLLEQAVKGPIFSSLSATNMCIQIREGDSFDITTASGETIITQTTGLCDGLENEDLIVRFNSFDAFVEIVSNPTPTALKLGSAGNRYYILESKLVRSGGDVVCDAEFKSNYCSAAKSLATPDELIMGDLSCCIDKPTLAQKKKISTHYASTGFINEYNSPNQESTNPTDNSLFLILGGSAFFLLIIVLVSVFVFRSSSKKEEPQDPKMVELENYVGQTLSQGYSEEQIKGYLAQQGWAQDKINESFNKVEDEIQNSKISIPEK